MDINPAAVRCTRLKALLNGLGHRMGVRRGDLYGPVKGERIDLIVLNPPFLRGPPRADHDHAWRARDVAERFARSNPVIAIEAAMFDLRHASSGPDA